MGRDRGFGEMMRDRGKVCGGDYKIAKSGG